jgi:thiamine biosynthesis lipoprotein
VQRALGWFDTVEQICSRFEPDSEVMRLSQRVGEPVPVSPLLIELVGFALGLADATHGAFDPTVGALLEGQGIHTSYRTGRPIDSGSARARPVALVIDRERSTMRSTAVVLDLAP